MVALSGGSPAAAAAVSLIRLACTHGWHPTAVAANDTLDDSLLLPVLLLKAIKNWHKRCLQCYKTQMEVTLCLGGCFCLLMVLTYASIHLLSYALKVVCIHSAQLTAALLLPTCDATHHAANQSVLRTQLQDVCQCAEHVFGTQSHLLTLSAGFRWRPTRNAPHQAVPAHNLNGY